MLGPESTINSEGCEFDSWLDKAGLTFVGIMDALMNCSLDSAMLIFSSQIHEDLKETQVKPPSGSDLGRLRALRGRLEKQSDPDEIQQDMAATAVRKMRLSDRLDPLLRRQVRCAWRPNTRG